MKKARAVNLNSPITRRRFLQASAVGAAGLVAGCALNEKYASINVSTSVRPNILFVHTDQQSFRTISALGCRHVHTPNMDRLVHGGTLFTESHSADPVCCPARASWYTGQPPAENGVVLNEVEIEPHMPDLGQWMTPRGYECVYVGKWHVPGRDLTKSFKVIPGGSNQGEHGDAAVSRAVEGYLRNRTGNEPFFLSAGLLQPHDIPYWFFYHTDRIEQLPYPQILDQLPELPPNFEFDFDEPELMAAYRKGEPRKYSQKWSELNWRYYLWSYYRCVEMADAEIGRILNALEDSRYADNTLVIFSSDHGEGMAEHELLSKSNLYESSLKVPLVFYWPGNVDAMRLDSTHLVSGLDVAPTICDYAGIEGLPKARGQSLRPVLENVNAPSREFVISSSMIHGRCVRTERYKLITYRHSTRDLLFDMKNDPHETKNLAGDSKYASVVADHKKILADFEAPFEVARVKKYPPFFKDDWKRL